MRIIGLIVLVIALLGVYLNRSYANFFNNIKVADLKSPITTNQLNRVDANKPIDKTMLFLGDSLTAGVGAKSEQNLLALQIQQKYFPTGNIQLINNGYPGAKVEDISIISENLKTQKTDLSIIFIGINDLFNRTPLDLFKQELSITVQNLKPNSARLVLLTLPYLGTRSSVPFPYDLLYNYQLSNYNTAIKDVALVQDVEVIDLYALTQNILNIDPALFAEDHFHPSDKGYILLADIIVQELNAN